MTGIRDDVCFLVAEAPKAHGVFDKPEESPRMVYCTTRSVGMREFYEAKDHKLNPSIVFVLQDAVEYRGEKIILYAPDGRHRQRYSVLRTYQTGHGLEITCEEATIDA